MRDEAGKVIETPEEMLRRVASNIAAVEERYGAARREIQKLAEDFFNSMANFDFLPNSPTLMNAGRQYQQLAACFVLPIEDSMVSIFDTLKNAALIHQSGGGCCAEGTIIPTIDYGFIPIEKIPQFENIPIDEKGHKCKLFEIFAFDEVTNSITRGFVTHVWKFEHDNYLRIQFGSEGVVEVTDWHPFIVYQPYPDMRSGGEYLKKRAGELNAGDWLVKPSFYDNLFLNDEPEFWWLYGFFLGDGSIDFTKNGVRLRFHNKDERNLTRIKNVIKNYTGSSGSQTTDPRTGVVSIVITSKFYKYEEKDYLSYNINELTANFFRRIIKLNRNRNDKKVPPSKSFLCPNPKAFISGLLDSDGWIGRDKAGITTSSNDLKDTIVKHLSMIGINCTTQLREDNRKQKLLGREIVFGKYWKIEFSSGFAQRLLTVKKPRKSRLTGGNKIQITSIEKIASKKKFYDFTVPIYHNYLGGTTQFVSIHNTGFSFSKLRPKGDPVRSSNGVASGPVSFMKIYDAAAEQIKQGGRRRGANMGVLRIDHPDILEFITVKDDPTVLTNFNISVAITDDFMRALEKNIAFKLKNPRTNQVVREIAAKKLFDLLCLMAWKNADPGVLFLDTINKANPTPNLGEIESTNPCGEVPLLRLEACNLGSINVANFVVNRKFDYPRLASTVDLAVQFLDNVIDASRYPLKEIDEMVKRNRKVGLGVMGFADSLIKLEIRYGSKDSFAMAEELMRFINTEAHNESERLAEERGVFPSYNGSIYEGKSRLRNATLTSIAPTGTLSLIAGCSSSIETLFGVVYRREILGGQVFYEINSYFEQLAKEEGFYSEDLMMKIANRGTLKGLEEVPQNIRDIFVTALEVTPEEHVKMQAAFQKYVDNAVSKTVNLPEESTVADVDRIFRLAYQLGCKGITVYRYGSKDHQVLSIGEENGEGKKKDREIKRKCVECGSESVVYHRSLKVGQSPP